MQAIAFKQPHHVIFHIKITLGCTAIRATVRHGNVSLGLYQPHNRERDQRHVVTERPEEILNNDLPGSFCVLDVLRQLQQQTVRCGVSPSM